jgi:hypothetical protein
MLLQKQNVFDDYPPSEPGQGQDGAAGAFSRAPGKANRASNQVTASRQEESPP